MSQWMSVLVFCSDVLFLSLLLAIFEILLEHEYGWGGRLNPKGWGKHLFAGTFVSDVCEKLYLTPYHIFMFAVVVPAILFCQLLAATHIRLVDPIRGIRATLFLGAMWFSLLGVEDVLWFALNWYYPTSWKDLLSGQVWWHTRWVALGPVKLPRFYLTTQLLAILLLVASLQGSGRLF